MGPVQKKDHLSEQVFDRRIVGENPDDTVVAFVFLINPLEQLGAPESYQC